jgi:hypothetical protein
MLSNRWLGRDWDRAVSIIRRLEEHDRRERPPRLRGGVVTALGCASWGHRSARGSPPRVRGVRSRQCWPHCGFAARPSSGSSGRPRRKAAIRMRSWSQRCARCRPRRWPIGTDGRAMIEAPCCQDTQGLGLVKRRQHRWEAQQMVVRLARLAHHLLVWSQRWLSRVPAMRWRLRGYGVVRLLQEVWTVPGKMRRRKGWMVSVHFAPLHPLAKPLQQGFAALFRGRIRGPTIIGTKTSATHESAATPHGSSVSPRCRTREEPPWRARRKGVAAPYCAVTVMRLDAPTLPCASYALACSW